MDPNLVRVLTSVEWHQQVSPSALADFNRAELIQAPDRVLKAGLDGER